MNDQIIDIILKNIELAEPLLANASQAMEQAERDMELIEPVLANASQAMEQAKVIENIDFSFLNDAIEAIEHEFIGDPSLERDWKTIDLLYNAGFWYIPSLPHPIFKNLLELDDKSKKNVSSLILELMNQDDCYHLSAMVNKWDLDEFEEKNEVFQEALKAHKEEKYVLSIPALVLQVEPLIKDYLSLDYKKKIWEIKNLLKDFIESRKEEKKREIWIDENKSRKLYLYLVSLQFVSKTVFEFYKGDQDFDNVKNTFNRHVISHGALRIKDFDQELSTKLLLFLDTLHFVLSFFKEELEN